MRNILLNENTQQITFADSRFYSSDGENWFPSVTHILDVYPKGFGFNEWLKQVGNNATQIVERAAEVGSKIHKATEDLNNGLELEWNDKLYSQEEWEMILKYVEFWNMTKPKLLANELSMCSSELGYGGTLDRSVEINGVRWLLDVKTSNYIHKTHELQLAAYAMMWNIKFPNQKIDRTGIIWLKANTRTDKIDHVKLVYQGKGWQIVTFDRNYEESFKIFQHTHAIWKEENPNPKPLNLVYPMKVKL